MVRKQGIRAYLGIYTVFRENIVGITVSARCITAGHAAWRESKRKATNKPPRQVVSKKEY